MLSFECIKNEKSVYFLLTSAYSEKLFFSLPILGMKGHKYSICPNVSGVMKVSGGKFTPTV